MRLIKFSWFLFFLLLLGCSRPASSAGLRENSTTENNVTSIIFEGLTAQVSGTGAVFLDRTLTIREPGTYVLSGILENGQVHINAGRDDAVSLVLNGVSLHNETGPAIFSQRSRETIIVLEEGTHNTISDSARQTDSDERNAAIYVQNNLHLTGEGSLSVIGNYRHGIRAQDILTITGGSITVDSTGHSLLGRNGVIIDGGNFTFNAGADGIQSSRTTGDDVGFITISGGDFNIHAQNDGIQAESTLTITGGVFHIVTGGGSASVPVRQSNFNRGWGGRPGPAIQTADDSVSMKGLKAGKQVIIMGGDFIIDTEDDGVHSDGDILITSGRLQIKTGDDGIHADGAVVISGGDIDIPVCYEGIEGLSVTISGGNISIISTNDALNAASPDDTPNMGWGRRQLNENIFVRITGGTVDLHAFADGIDSNGNIFIEGGMLMISGPSMIMEGAVDFDGAFVITGGELITAGSILGISQGTTQPVILVSYTRQQASGSVIAIKDQNENTLLEYTSKTAFSYSGFTSPHFSIGETYSLFINGEKRTDIRLNNIGTGISDTGGTYNQGRGRW